MQGGYYQYPRNNHNRKELSNSAHCFLPELSLRMVGFLHNPVNHSLPSYSNQNSCMRSRRPSRVYSKVKNSSEIRKVLDSIHF
jgi:hypothetical protein